MGFIIMGFLIWDFKIIIIKNNIGKKDYKINCFNIN